MKLKIIGASHAPKITFELTGFPAGVKVDAATLNEFMARRAPGKDALSTTRKEADKVEFVTGFNQGVTDGSTITGYIKNTDIRPHDYGEERTVVRPGHADFGQWIEQGRIPTGGGANSGRLTAAYCAIGALCLQWLKTRGVTIKAELVDVGGKRDQLEREILKAKKRLDSVGGTIRCTANGVRPGLGGAMFAGLEGPIAANIFAIPGVKAVEFGLGVEASKFTGSKFNDEFIIKDGEVKTLTNNHGGILGGRASGMPITVKVTMKPTPTIFLPQPTVDLKTMTKATCAMKGRHDPCIARRAVPVVEAMMAYSLAGAMMDEESRTPRICLSLTGKTIKACLAQYNEQRYFTDMVELRVDYLNKSERTKVAKLLNEFKLPVIVTFRRKAEGGAYKGSEAARVNFFKGLLNHVERAIPWYVDFEDDFRVKDLEQLAAKAGATIVRSLHDFKSKPRSLVKTLKLLKGKSNDIPKIAFGPKNLMEIASAFKELKHFTEFPHVVCAMGAAGLFTRVLAGRLGSQWTYTSISGLTELGHISPFELVKTFRYRVLTPNTRLLGVTGYPLKTTRSPELNNAAFTDECVDAVMIPFPALTAKDAIKFFKAMNLRGMAVTIPHKETIMPLLDYINPEAKAIGAVNTVVADNGRLIGYNTDAIGFKDAITAFWGKPTLKGVKVALLGSGGAAKAVSYALKQLKAKVEVFHRRPLTAGFDLIVNATPVDPIPEYKFTGKEAVYDLRYAPSETPLLKRARASGASVENGLSMLIAQAKYQRAWYKL